MTGITLVNGVWRVLLLFAFMCVTLYAAWAQDASILEFHELYVASLGSLLTGTRLRSI